MNEEMFPNKDGQVLGPGRLLQIAREEKNLRPEDVAYEIRLTPTQVLALEENDYSKMPEETYVRGYLRNYARLVSVPENDILMAFARFTRSGEKKPQPVIPKGQGDIHKGGKGIRLLALFIIVAVIALSAVWVLEPYDNLTLKGEKNTAPVPKENTVKVEVPVGVSTLSLDTPTENPVPVQTPPAAETPQPREANAAESSISTEAVTISEQETETLPVTAEQSGAASQIESTGALQTTETTEPAADTAAGEGTLYISYSKDSWTDVRDADGKKLLYRTVKKGEKIALAGKLPMSLFFGFAQGVSVTYNGTEIDVTSHTRGVFARFTVGEPANP